MKTNLKIVIGLAIVGSFAGCGGSGKSTPGMTPPAAVDAFTHSVQAVVAYTSDTSMPIGIDGIAVSGSDGALPVGL